jgi:hypothetical protein
LSNGGPPVGSSVTDSVGTSDVSMGIHIIAPFDKTLDFTIPPSWFYYGICIPSWRYSCNWASYYLSNLSIEPPIRPM